MNDVNKSLSHRVSMIILGAFLGLLGDPRLLPVCVYAPSFLHQFNIAAFRSE